MAKQKADPDRQAKSALLYGMQGTGSNYIQQHLFYPAVFQESANKIDKVQP
jgi:hypothetical protein